MDFKEGKGNIVNFVALPPQGSITRNVRFFPRSSLLVDLCALVKDREILTFEVWLPEENTLCHPDAKGTINRGPFYRMRSIPWLAFTVQLLSLLGQRILKALAGPEAARS